MDILPSHEQASKSKEKPMIDSRDMTDNEIAGAEAATAVY